MDPFEHELKKEFQLERMIFFSDAVFAIAITLLVLEIRIPDIRENISDKALLHELKLLFPKFIGFVISFMLIGLYWTIHHKMFGYVIRYNPKLLRLNLFLLFFIVLMPFSTGFYGNYVGGELVQAQLKVPMTFYVGNLCCVGISNFFLLKYISSPKNHLIDKNIDAYSLKMSKVRALVVPSIFVIMLFVAYISNVLYAVFIPMLIPPIMKLIQRKVKKKNMPETKQIHHE